jgi:hypothetical protein
VRRERRAGFRKPSGSHAGNIRVPKLEDSLCVSLSPSPCSCQ